MILGKVIGTVVSSRKESELVGLKFLTVAPVNPRTGEIQEGGIVQVGRECIGVHLLQLVACL